MCNFEGDVCQELSCGDGILNGTETDVDCGGGCKESSACADGQACENADDCESDVCSEGECSPASCNDGIRNGDELGVDCGSYERDCGPCSVTDPMNPPPCRLQL